MAQLN